MRTRKIVESEHVLNHGRHVNCCSRRDGFNMLHSGSNASPVEFVAVAGFCFKLVFSKVLVQSSLCDYRASTNVT